MRQLPSVRRALTNEHVQSIRDYIVCRRVDRTAFLRNVQRIAECIVHFFLIEELVAEDDQLVIVRRSTRGQNILNIREYSREYRWSGENISKRI